jgi:hypothetical protein
MIGKRSSQADLFDIGNVYDLKLNPRSFHAQLAHAAPRLFKDEDFTELYHQKCGRPSVPPAILALLVVLQFHAQTSDQETIDRSAYDARWAAVLRRSIGTPVCAKSTLQLFRAHLFLHKKANALFLSSLKEAKDAGLLKGSLIALTDTKPMLGRGAAQDTFNLLGTAVVQLSRALAKEQQTDLDTFLKQEGLTRYQEQSLKASADLDWSDEAAKNAFLTTVVAEARALLQKASGASKSVVEAAQLLSALLLQDIEEKPSETGPPKATIKEGTTPGRMPSATDPEVRHGRKSQSHLFKGHKSAIVTDAQSQIIVAVDIIAGDAPDNTGALALIHQSEENTGLSVEETQADCAYGDAKTRQAFVEEERLLHAKVPKSASRNGLFPKSAFTIDLVEGSVTCPSGKVRTTFTLHPDGSKTYSFGSSCNDCPLRAQCTTAAGGRSVSVAAHEELLQKARSYQQTPEGRANLRKRVGVEHALARLSWLGISQARYRGRDKSRFQLLMAATVANLRLTWNWQAQGEQNSGEGPSSVPIFGYLQAVFGQFVAFWLALQAIGLPECRCQPDLT